MNKNRLRGHITLCDTDTTSAAKTTRSHTFLDAQTFHNPFFLTKGLKYQALDYSRDPNFLRNKKEEFSINGQEKTSRTYNCMCLKSHISSCMHAQSMRQMREEDK